MPQIRINPCQSHPIWGMCKKNVLVQVRLGCLHVDLDRRWMFIYIRSKRNEGNSIVRAPQRQCVWWSWWFFCKYLGFKFVWAIRYLYCLSRCTLWLPWLSFNYWFLKVQSVSQEQREQQVVWMDANWVVGSCTQPFLSTSSSNPSIFWFHSTMMVYTSLNWCPLLAFQCVCTLYCVVWSCASKLVSARCWRATWLSLQRVTKAPDTDAAAGMIVSFNSIFNF